MSILLDEKTKLLVQGITGRGGRHHTKLCKSYGTNIVAGVTPGKGGTEVDGIPVFDNVLRAVEVTGANASIIFVPAPFAKDAMLEAIETELGLIVCITDGVPVHDMMQVRHALRLHKTCLIGPNCPGIISPGKALAGIHPAEITEIAKKNSVFMPGNVGIVSRSGSLTYEAALQLTGKGIGQSTCVGIGGDAIIGTDFIGILELFRNDPETHLVLMVGEIGGTAEQKTAEYIAKTEYPKPIVAYIAGQTAPPGKKMGHAGAIVQQGKGTAKKKMSVLRAAGVTVVRNPLRIGENVKKVIKKRLS